MTLALDTVLDTTAAAPLRAALRKSVTDQQPLALDGSAVESVGQACLQVLAAAEAAAYSASLDFRILNPSAALTEMTRLVGLDTLLKA
ncbi:STAS domain-containing protein [Pacificimonas sp. WHA3]|uniref:STAS domain-containing protein n=1 Tax=Pacificimonas pallii TaxID=2827236 RepID=A0ABS6SFG5_9SPHN|nr:STAS domain-containing protein [Pacificimonas pallii]MBV7257158.1 STAS domain-containing protein [Pacificimonas pallii]